MKKRLCTMACLLALMAFGQENILKNADCKEIGANGVPVGWFPQSGAIEHGGDGGADFTLSGKDGKNGIVTQTVKIPPNVPYVFSYDMKSTEEGMAMNYLEWHWPDNGVEAYGNSGINKTRAPKEWKSYKFMFSYPTETTAGYVAFFSLDGAKIQFRNVVVRPARIRKDEGTGGHWNLEKVDSFTDDGIIVKGGNSAELYGIPVKEGMTYRLSYDAIGIGEVDPDYPFHEISTHIEPHVLGMLSFNDVSNTTQRKFQKFKVQEGSGVTSISITFTAKTKASIGFSNFKLETVIPDPRDSWRLEVVEPFYRNTLYASHMPKQIHLRIHTDGMPQEAQCSFGNVKKTISLNGAKAADVALD
ncbi:MAG: hypothetical protein J5833_09535, partial [Victivallales bacterium]|nr:hypothetical protein [Victivallales bacterium]